MNLEFALVLPRLDKQLPHNLLSSLTQPLQYFVRIILVILEYLLIEVEEHLGQVVEGVDVSHLLNQVVEEHSQTLRDEPLGLHSPLYLLFII